MFPLIIRRKANKVVLVALVALVIIVSLFLFNSILGQMVFRRTISSSGRIQVFGVGVYWDKSCSIPVSYINWGLVEPGLARDFTVCIKNEGNYATTFFLEAENWTPENASNYLTLKWDYAGQIINPSGTIQVVLSLIASLNVEAITDFSFDIVIGGNA